MDVTIYIDGGSRGNPGPAAAGVVLRDHADDRTLHEGGYFLGRVTNNAAEYGALVKALQLAQELGARCVHVHSDSELVVRQITGEYRVKSADLTPLFEQAQGLLLAFEVWQIRHVPREENTRADQLANIAMDRKRDVIISSTLGRPPAAGGAADAAASETISGPVPTATGAEAAMVLPPDALLPVSDHEAIAPPQRPEQPRAGTPQWTAEILAAPGAECPRRCAVGTVFRFGPGTPEGMCVHAAAVVFDEGPLVWDDPAQREDFTFCPRCRARIRIERTDE